MLCIDCKVSFFIYEDIIGSATSYTIKYFDSATGAICGLHSINATSCISEVCSNEFEISSSLCTPSSDINVTVSAVTILGEGPQTNPTKEGLFCLCYIHCFNITSGGEGGGGWGGAALSSITAVNSRYNYGYTQV
jgi:hypothetical protein